MDSCTDPLYRHVSRSLKTLMKNVRPEDELDEDDLEEMVRCLKLTPMSAGSDCAL